MDPVWLFLQAEFLTGDNINGIMIFKYFNIGLVGDGLEKGFFNFLTGHVFGMEDSSLGVAPFLSRVVFGFGGI